MKRSSGILMPIFSLPSDYGIGTFGVEAYKFIDFLYNAKQTYWQILPFMQTGFANSPYSSVSSFAGNYFFIDFDELMKDGLLNKSDYDFLVVNDSRRVDYNLLFKYKLKILKIAVNNCIKYYSNELNEFILNNNYLNDYALYCSIKNKFNLKSFNNWSYEYKFKHRLTIDSFSKDNKDEILFYNTIQYLFYKQWFKLKKYANSKGIKIIGDTPMYNAYDSVEVWADSDNFYLNDNKEPIEIAGCPPDNYSAKGQIWGNPLYNLDYIKDNNYKYFKNKFSFLLNVYDVLRLDHFRGFDSFYAIPYGNKDANSGRWVKGFGLDLFNSIKDNINTDNIIVEDLGFLTQSVRKLLQDTGFAGMKVLEFAFDLNDTNNEYLPHNYIENCIAYIGTHDNDTFAGWFKSLNDNVKQYVIDYFGLKDSYNYYKEVIIKMMESNAVLTIFQFQDLLNMDSNFRINTPSTLSDDNWSIRVLKNELDNSIEEFLKNYTIITKRI